MIWHTMIGLDCFIAVEIEAWYGNILTFCVFLLFQKGKKHVLFNFAYILLWKPVQNPVNDCNCFAASKLEREYSAN
jgi:hypothetical protein